jgi:V/A-type H+-transporting ATPase subunit K
MTKNVAKFKVTVGMMTFVTVVMGLLLGFATLNKLNAQSADEATNIENATVASTNNQSSSNLGLGILGAGIAFGLAALGAGAAVGNASSAAIGAISEKPEMFGRSLIFVALGEGIMIIGFAMAFILLGRL